VIKGFFYQTCENALIPISLKCSYKLLGVFFAANAQNQEDLSFWAG